MVRRPDVFGAKTVSVDDGATRKVPGVVDVQTLPNGGVAVYATNTWAAIEGRKALNVTYDFSQAETRSSKDMFDEYRSLLGKPGVMAVRNGDAAGALGRAAKKIDVEFQIPFLAHAPMEPLNCTVDVSAQGAEIWSGSQVQTVDHEAAAFTLGLPLNQVKINTMLAGGSFGRRASPSASWVIEACQAAKAIGGRAPVHLVWSSRRRHQGRLLPADGPASRAGGRDGRRPAVRLVSPTRQQVDLQRCLLDSAHQSDL